MFDFAKTVVCGIGKGVIATLAVIGGAFVTVTIVDDNFANSVIKACGGTINEELESEGD